MPNEIVPRLDLPALVPAPGGAVVRATDGSCQRARIDEARVLFRSGNVIVAHAAFVAGRLKTNPAAALFDVLELFVFVRPGQPCVPSALGMAQVGSPETVKAGVEAFIARHRPDELMVTGQIYDHAARLRSYEILSGL